jgi:hypothetical protein
MTLPRDKFCLTVNLCLWCTWWLAHLLRAIYLLFFSPLEYSLCLKSSVETQKTNFSIDYHQTAIRNKGARALATTFALV